MTSPAGRTIGTLITAVVAATASAAPAQAGPNEDLYLRLIHDSNVAKFGPETELAIGHQICDGWASGTQTAMDIANTTMTQFPQVDLATALTYQTPAVALCLDAARNSKKQ